MAERATLSISQYTKSPDYIMASEIAANYVAFDRIATAGRLQSNLSVVWTNETPHRSILHPGIRLTTLPLIRKDEGVILRINDDLLMEKAQRRAKKRSDRSEGNYNALTKEEFVRGFSREVAGALTSTLYTDKLSLSGHIKDYGLLAFLGIGVLLHLPPSDPQDLGALGISSAVTGWFLWYEDRHGVDAFGRQLLAPARFVRGYWQILKNQSRLIVERD